MAPKEGRHESIDRAVRDSLEIFLAVASLRYEKAARLLVNKWLQVFRINPRVVVTVTVVIPTIWIVAIVLVIVQAEKKQEIARSQNANYSEQAERLRQTQRSLKDLLQFVDDQQRTIEVKQDLIGNLEKEQESLEGLVEIDRATVNKLFDEQARRLRRSIWTERIVSFFIGMLASLLATIAWHALGKKSQLESSTT